MATKRKPAAKKKARRVARVRRAPIVKAAEVVTTQPSGASIGGVDFNRIVEVVAQAQVATQHLPALAAEHVRKAWRSMEKSTAERGPKAWFLDPFDTQMMMGWKERRSGFSYEMLKEVERQLAVVRAIINVRSAQLSSFCEPYDETNSLGFKIIPKDRARRMTPFLRNRCAEISQFIVSCGQPRRNSHSVIKRDRMDTFVRKLVRDSLLFDAAAIEIVPDEDGIPYEFYAVDGTTIRFAPTYESQALLNMGSSWAAKVAEAQYDDLSYNPISEDGKPVKYLQVINNNIASAFTEDELIYGTRNPRSDIYVGGYGFSEIEQAITIVTALIDTEKYQSNLFKNGTMPRGLLNLKGTEWTTEQLESVKRQWAAQLQGGNNAHRMPIMQFDGDLQFVNLQQTSKDMEFGRYHEFLYSIFCGVCLIDPLEVVRTIHGGDRFEATLIERSGNEAKSKTARDRGLKPMLRFFAGMFQQIVDKIDDSMQFRFIGLDEPTENEKHQRRLEELASFRTLDDVRNAAGLEPYYDPDVGRMIMSPTVLQAHKLALEAKMMGATAPDGE